MLKGNNHQGGKVWSRFGCGTSRCPKGYEEEDVGVLLATGGKEQTRAEGVKVQCRFIKANFTIERHNSEASEEEALDALSCMIEGACHCAKSDMMVKEFSHPVVPS